ncbi:hypothetical protein D9615_005924 [Tricholomella constricta]|uniref:Uncharacterized protein n=1 Tax=Tricholomella constricta TaxID=117010 RepID=A0A8H5H9G7_9AGAR|nr:hypothetical protein D9615_005924 [Tricholomella constricta]
MPQSKPVAGPRVPLATEAKDQYHHFIPRFILRRYYANSSSSESSGQRKPRRKFQTPEERDAETVLFYDIPSLILSSQPLSKVYGVQNLYRDVSAQDINELEKSLSILENHAARIINTLHQHTQGDFTLKRKDLYYLRKFLFVMHYRQSKLSNSYFQEDHPENRPLVPWIRNFKKEHDLKTSTDLWLFTIRYYMDTPHSEICQHAEKTYEKYGRNVLDRGMVDPNMEHYNALAYALQAQDYFLGFWEAPEGTEFILGHNGFGIWEGNSFPLSMMHRIFVVGPRFAVVLRHNNMLPLNIRNQRFLNTDFKDIKHGLPRITSMDPAAENDADVFAFKITHLTKAQMQAFNSVILSNVRKDGSITFLSKEYVLAVLQAHHASSEYASDRLRYAPLITTLSTPDPSGPPDPPWPSTDSPSLVASLSPADPSLSTSNTNLYAMVYNFSNLGCKPWIGGNRSNAPSNKNKSLNDAPGILMEYRAIMQMPVLIFRRQPIVRPTDPNIEFVRVLNDIQNGSLTFPSRYDKAYRLFNMCNMEIHAGNPFETEVRRMSASVISRFRSILKPPPRNFVAKPHARIVESLPELESATLFRNLHIVLARLNVNLDSDPRFLSQEIAGVVALKFLTWIARNRHDILLSLLPNIVVVKE